VPESFAVSRLQLRIKGLNNRRGSGEGEGEGQGDEEVEEEEKDG
jgi:hypothetical protein